MIENLYRKYLLADRMNKIAKAAGVELHTITLDNATDVYRDVSALAHRYGETPEETAARILRVAPHLEVRMSDALLYLGGETRQGLRFEFYFGSVSLSAAFNIEDRLRELVNA